MNNRKRNVNEEHVSMKGVKYFVSPLGFSYVMEGGTMIDICTACSEPGNLVKMTSICGPYFSHICPICGKEESYTD